jgi:hypothetical protein
LMVDHHLDEIGALEKRLRSVKSTPVRPHPKGISGRRRKLEA